MREEIEVILSILAASYQGGRSGSHRILRYCLDPQCILRILWIPPCSSRFSEKHRILRILMDRECDGDLPTIPIGNPENPEDTGPRFRESRGISMGILNDPSRNTARGYHENPERYGWRSRDSKGYNRDPRDTVFSVSAMYRMYREGIGCIATVSS